MPVNEHTDGGDLPWPGRETLDDGHGRASYRLNAFRGAWGDRSAMGVGASTVPRSTRGAGDLLALKLGQNVLLFGPEG